jgi:hypothetical protein
MKINRVSARKSLDLEPSSAYLARSFSTHLMDVLTAWTGGGSQAADQHERKLHEIPSAA